MNYAGIDHHRQYSHITWLNEKGEVVKSGRVANVRRDLEGFFQGARDVKAVIGAGRSNYTMVDVLDDLGISTTVAHPQDGRAIARARIKTDERDSWKLAHLLRTGYIPEVDKRSRENRSWQRVLRQRAFYVGKQTAVKNRLRALLAQEGEEIRSEVERVEDLFTDKGMKVLKGLALPEREAKLVGALLRTYHHLEERINETNALVKQLDTKMPSAQLIQTVPGFGIFLFDTRCFYDRLKKRKGANSAKVATARRLLTIIYRMLKENRPHHR